MLVTLALEAARRRRAWSETGSGESSTSWTASGKASLKVRLSWSKSKPCQLMRRARIHSPRTMASVLLPRLPRTCKGATTRCLRPGSAGAGAAGGGVSGLVASIAWSGVSGMGRSAVSLGFFLGALIGANALEVLAQGVAGPPGRRRRGGLGQGRRPRAGRVGHKGRGDGVDDPRTGAGLDERKDPVGADLQAVTRLQESGDLLVGDRRGLAAQLVDFAQEGVELGLEGFAGHGWPACRGRGRLSTPLRGDVAGTLGPDPKPITALNGGVHPGGRSKSPLSGPRMADVSGPG